MKLLYFDIETSPLLVYTWGLYDQNISQNQIVADWSVLAWCAKWRGEKSLLYEDNRKSKDVRNDKSLLKQIWELLDEADVVVTQNGRSFDSKKLNARFIINGMKPPSSYKHEDTKVIAKKHFAFTSNGLEYMSKNLNEKYTKLDHKKFPGQELWNECLKGNQQAWKEMEKYNKHDVLALEELYDRLSPWGGSIDPALYSYDEAAKCICGSDSFLKRGYFYTAAGKFQRYRCNKCGKESRSKTNLFTLEKKKGLRK
jgi:uncharacterized protein YprB with RNaseH-like and TPR domain